MNGNVFDVAVVGGGVLGCGTALHLARGGMRVVLVERGRLCREASGANAGGMTMQDKPLALIPYYLRARELWQEAPEWLGMDAGFRPVGGMMVAFTEAEAASLEVGLEARRAAGLAIEVMTAAKARAVEPGLSDHVTLVTYCPMDGYGNATLNGLAYGRALASAGVEVREATAVTAIERGGTGFVLAAAGRELRARRLVLAAGVWLREIGRWFGLDLPILCDVKQMVVAERLPRVLNSVMRSANQRLSVKQVESGTVLFGGGWPAKGNVRDGGIAHIPESVIGNVRVARFAIPALGRARLVRAWIGLETYVADRMPVAGPLPGVDGAYIIGGILAGYTMSPYITRLVAEAVLGHEPERPLFDPARLLKPAAARAAPAAAQ